MVDGSGGGLRRVRVRMSRGTGSMVEGMRLAMSGC